ncbi:hypothetical protein BCR35DRAFT_336540 [Leucosporidium creatinivorum]|uniref:Uncharacterized protein n=1 Tax=Leucosporidium creatinivorum TaxID=106004 RepID=A0A1Y2BXK4_9BASI|nr:hypothetical protein BCR35DRAFT_336540 [Leucosporidium creatinivorum]
MVQRPSTGSSTLGSLVLPLLLLLAFALASVPSAGAAPTSGEKSSTIAAISLLPSPYTSHLVIRNSTTSLCFDCSSPNATSHLDTTFSITSRASPEATLAELRRLAHDFLNGDSGIREAVVSVPLSWTDEQRQTLSLSAKRSGLDILRLVSRPTASSLAYGIDREPYSPPESAQEQSSGPWGRAIIVVDVLGGSVDALEAEVTVLDVDEGVFEIFGTTAARGGSAEIGRAVERALELANTRAARIDNYLLVGEASLDPSLSQTLASLLPNAEQWNTSSIPTNLAAVYGAAVQASFLGEPECSSGDWVGAFEVTPLSLGVETSNGLLHRLVPRNYILPRRVVANFTTSEDDQTSASLRLFAGEHPSAQGNHLLTTLDLEGIEPAAAGETFLKFVLELSPYYETASLSIEDRDSGKSNSIIIPLTSPRGDDWIEIEESILALEKLDYEREQRGEEKPRPSKGLPPVPVIGQGRVKDEL